MSPPGQQPRLLGLCGRLACPPSRALWSCSPGSNMASPLSFTRDKLLHRIRGVGRRHSCCFSDSFSVKTPHQQFLSFFIQFHFNCAFYFVTTVICMLMLHVYQIINDF